MTPENLFYEDQLGGISKSSQLEYDFLRIWKSAQRHFIAKCTLVGIAAFAFLSALLYLLIGDRRHWQN